MENSIDICMVGSILKCTQCTSLPADFILGEIVLDFPDKAGERKARKENTNSLLVIPLQSLINKARFSELPSDGATSSLPFPVRLVFGGREWRSPLPDPTISGFPD
jgi:hypothetical protein